MKRIESSDVEEAKKAVLEAAFGICALPELELLQRLESIYWKGWKAGNEFVTGSLIDDINKHFSEPLDP